MLNKSIALILLVFMAMPLTASADQPPAPSAKTLATMSDEALASYISGRLNQALKGQDYSVTNSCDDSGCSVVVQ